MLQNITLNSSLRNFVLTFLETLINRQIRHLRQEWGGSTDGMGGGLNLPLSVPSHRTIRQTGTKTTVSD